MVHTRMYFTKILIFMIVLWVGILAEYLCKILQKYLDLKLKYRKKSQSKPNLSFITCSSIHYYTKINKNRGLDLLNANSTCYMGESERANNNSALQTHSLKYLFKNILN